MINRPVPSDRTLYALFAGFVLFFGVSGAAFAADMATYEMPTRVEVEAAGAGVGARLAQPISCTKNGTLWTCREGTVGNVVAQLQDYASCVVESDCRWEYAPGPGAHAADTRWFLTGVD